MSGGTVDRLREMLAEGRRDEAHGLLAETREGSRRPPDPEELGGARIGAVPGSGGGDDPWLAAWSLPEELGGGALFVGGGPVWKGPWTTLVDPGDTVVVSFGGIGAAVGSVPLDVYRRTADGETTVLAARTVEVGPGSYGEPFEGPTPEELLAETEELLDAVREATGCRWLRSGELEQEEWDREAFLERYNALAEEAGVEPLDGPTVDRENYWMRYEHSVGHDTLEAFARDAFRAREAPTAYQPALEAAADALGWMVREETGIRPRDLTVTVEGPRFEARAAGRALATWPCPRAEWDEVREDVRAEHGDGAEEGGPEASGGELSEALGTRIAEELSRRTPDGLEDELVEAELERVSALVSEEVERLAREALAALAPEHGLDLSVEVVEVPRSHRHGDPEEAGERSLPPLGVRVRSWDPDAEAVVPIEREPPDPERLARDAAERLRERLGGDGAGESHDA